MVRDVQAVGYFVTAWTHGSPMHETDDVVWMWWDPERVRLAAYVYWKPAQAPRWTRLRLNIDWDYKTRLSIPLGIPRRWLYDESTLVYTFLRTRCRICGRDRWIWRSCSCPYRRAGI